MPRHSVHEKEEGRGEHRPRTSARRSAIETSPPHSPSDSLQKFPQSPFSQSPTSDESSHLLSSAAASGGAAPAAPDQHHRHHGDDDEENGGGDTTRSSFADSTELEEHGEKRKAPLSTMSLFALLFTFTCGGGYGFEDAVGAAKPLPVTLFCVFVPWIWCLPTALAVSELATMLPSNAGFLLWSDLSLPKQVTMFNALATAVSAFIGNSSYPSLFAQYVNSYFYDTPTMSNGVDVSAIPSKVGIVVLATIMNIIGVDVVGGAAMLLSFFTTLPFVLIFFIQLLGPIWFDDTTATAIGMPPGSAAAALGGNNISNRTTSFVNGSNSTSWGNSTEIGLQPGLDFTTIGFANAWDLSWPAFLSVGSWNYAGYEAAGQVCEEVQNPQQTLMRAFVPLMISTYIAYLLPVWAGVSVFKAGPNQNWNNWKAGYWPTVAGYVAQNRWLEHYLRAASVLASIGYTISALTCNSRLLAGIGQIGALPKRPSAFLSAYSPRFKTPVNAILIMSAAAITISILFSFESIVAVMQSLYMFRMLTVYWALLYMRRKYPHLKRPFRIPLPDKWLPLLVLPPTIFSCSVMICAVLGDLLTELVAVIFVVVAAIVAFFAVKYGFFSGIDHGRKSDDGSNAYLPKGIVAVGDDKNSDDDAEGEDQKQQQEDEEEDNAGVRKGSYQTVATASDT